MLGKIISDRYKSLARHLILVAGLIASIKPTGLCVGERSASQTENESLNLNTQNKHKQPVSLMLVTEDTFSGSIH